MKPTTALLLGALALWLLGEGAPATGQRPRERHPPAMRRCELVALLGPLLAARGITGAAAWLLLGHVARETGGGHDVYWFNFGNVARVAGRPWYAKASGQYRAYDSLADGLDGVIRAVQHISPAAWRQLLAGDVLWYSQLGRDGYYTDPVAHAQPDYETITANLRRDCAAQLGG